MYVGYSMSYEQCYDVITTANTNNITHIIFEFIVIGDQYGWDKLTIVDTVNGWLNFSSTDQSYLHSYAASFNIKILLSFGGGLNFISSSGTSFSNLWLLSTSKYYLGIYASLEDSANALVTDILFLIDSKNVDGIDFDIEWILTYEDYMKETPPVGFTLQWSDVYNYLGYLSRGIKQEGYIVSHAPQTPYFYQDATPSFKSWNGVYYFLEYFYGQYIDFYSIQYYNNGLYNTKDSIFTHDTEAWEASVTQLIAGYNPNSEGVYETINIPVEKIVVGKPSDPSTQFPGSSSSAWIQLAGWVNDQAAATETLQEWYSRGGVMVWVYYSDPVQDDNDTNPLVLDYFSSV